MWKVHNDVFRHISIVWSLALCICNIDDCASGTIEESPSGIEVLVAQCNFGSHTNKAHGW